MSELIDFYPGKLRVNKDTEIVGDLNVTGDINGTVHSHSRRNLLINGCFRLSNYGGSSTGGTGYKTVDRWRSNTSNQKMNHTAQASTTLGFPMCLKLTKTVSTGNMGIAQAIELDLPGYNGQFAIGKSVTLSFYVYCTEDCEITPNIKWSDGATNTNSVTIVNWSDNITGGSWKKLSFTTTINNSPVSTNKAVRVYLGGQSLSVDALLYFAEAQLEFGDKATEFEYRPYSEEERLCRRYYQLIVVNSSAWRHNHTAVGSNRMGYHTLLPVKMRANPSVTFSNWVTNNCSFHSHGVGNDYIVVKVTTTSVHYSVDQFHMRLSAEL